MDFLSSYGLLTQKNEMKQKQEKMKIEWWYLPYILAYGFFLFFFVSYAGKYGLSDLVLKGQSKHEILFNIGVWMVLVMFCLDGFFDSLSKLHNRMKK